MAIPAARPPQVAPPKPSRMTLASVVTGRQKMPVRIVIHGVDGVGKTTFAAGAPSPIFLGSEEGTAALDVARFPSPESWAELLEAIHALTTQDHDYQTLALDSLDWAEPLCWASVCEDGKKQSIEDFGYGKGYVAALDKWRGFLAALERLRKAKGMHVVLIAHSICKTFKNPADEDFDRYQLKLHDKAAGLIREWSDAVCFAAYEVIAAKNEKTNRVRGVDTGARLLHTSYRAAWDAKNRYSLPETLPLGWDDFYAAVEAQQVADPATLRTAIEANLAQLDDETQAKVRTTLEKAGNNAAFLAQINNRINAILATKGEANGTA